MLFKLTVFIIYLTCAFCEDTSTKSKTKVFRGHTKASIKDFLQYDDGKYHPERDLQYKHFDNGQYKVDFSGLYMHQDVKYVHVEPPAVQYVHVDGPNGPSSVKYVHDDHLHKDLMRSVYEENKNKYKENESFENRKRNRFKTHHSANEGRRRNSIPRRIAMRDEAKDFTTSEKVDYNINDYSYKLSTELLPPKFDNEVNLNEENEDFTTLLTSNPTTTEDSSKNIYYSTTETFYQSDFQDANTQINDHHSFPNLPLENNRTIIVENNNQERYINTNSYEEPNIHKEATFQSNANNTARNDYSVSNRYDGNFQFSHENSFQETDVESKMLYGNDENYQRTQTTERYNSDYVNNYEFSKDSHDEYEPSGRTLNNSHRIFSTNNKTSARNYAVLRSGRKYPTSDSGKFPNKNLIESPDSQNQYTERNSEGLEDTDKVFESQTTVNDNEREEQEIFDGRSDQNDSGFFTTTESGFSSKQFNQKYDQEAQHSNAYLEMNEGGKSRQDFQLQINDIHRGEIPNSQVSNSEQGIKNKFLPEKSDTNKFDHYVIEEGKLLSHQDHVQETEKSYIGTQSNRDNTINYSSQIDTTNNEYSSRKLDAISNESFSAYGRDKDVKYHQQSNDPSLINYNKSQERKKLNLPQEEYSGQVDIGRYRFLSKNKTDHSLNHVGQYIKKYIEENQSDKHYESQINYNASAEESLKEERTQTNYNEQDGVYDFELIGSNNTSRKFDDTNTNFQHSQNNNTHHVYNIFKHQSPSSYDIIQNSSTHVDSVPEDSINNTVISHDSLTTTSNYEQSYTEMKSNEPKGDDQEQVVYIGYKRTTPSYFTNQKISINSVSGKAGTQIIKSNTNNKLFDNAITATKALSQQNDSNNYSTQTALRNESTVLIDSQDNQSKNLNGLAERKPKLLDDAFNYNTNLKTQNDELVQKSKVISEDKLGKPDVVNYSKNVENLNNNDHTLSFISSVGKGVSYGIGKYDIISKSGGDKSGSVFYKCKQVSKDGYRFNFDTNSGIRQDEQGALHNRGTDKEAMCVTGYYTYLGPDNKEYKVYYTADEYGFRPEGEHIHSGILRLLKDLQAGFQ